jgi:flagellin-specific chaperone FliS
LSYKTYRTIQANSCDPGSLLLLLYDKTMIEIQKSILLLEQGEAMHGSLIKAHLGVMELDKTLNFNVLPELAESLHNLYLHVLLLMGEANVESLTRALMILRQLRETWEQAAKKAPAAEAV